MTQRIYYTDAYATRFDATVLESTTADGRPAVVLDRTAFYPTSGGQPCDTGTLGSAAVVEVFERDDGEIVHVTSAPVGPGPVQGSIDWDRRFAHMQQHTGQHVLSAAFERVCQATTQSFHLGASSSTIDLDREVSPSQIADAELAANRVVWEDRPVEVRFVDPAEAAALPLRKDPARHGLLRIVEVEGFDVSACGGTHVARTGGIGNVGIAGWERFRGGTRLEFVCGVRALRAYRALRDAAVAASRLLSTGAAEVPTAVQRLQAENKDARRRIKEIEEKLAAHEASALAARAVAFSGGSIVLEALDGWDAAGLKALAAAIARRPRHAALLASGPQPASIAAARADGVPIDAGALVKEVAARFGGRGGGRAEAAQAGGLNAPAEEIVSFARQLLNATND